MVANKTVRVLALAALVALGSRHGAVEAQAAEGGGALGEPFVVTFDVANKDAGAKSGLVTLTVHPEWAPIGAARFKELVESGFYDGACYFRALKGFMAQMGFPPDPKSITPAVEKQIQDDRPGKASNLRSMVTFATAGPNTRTFQIFFNFGDNKFLDRQGFTPFAEVTSGMDIIDQIHITGEGAPNGPGPSQGKLRQGGNAYLMSKWPQVSCVRRAWVGAAVAAAPPLDVPPLAQAPGSDLVDAAAAEAAAEAAPITPKGGSVAGGLASESEAVSLYGGQTPVQSTLSVLMFVFTVVVTLYACFKLNSRSDVSGSRDLEA